jgi:hypothetical protein
MSVSAAAGEVQAGHGSRMLQVQHVRVQLQPGAAHCRRQAGVRHMGWHAARLPAGLDGHAARGAQEKQQPALFSCSGLNFVRERTMVASLRAAHRSAAYLLVLHTWHSHACADRRCRRAAHDSCARVNHTPMLRPDQCGPGCCDTGVCMTASRVSREYGWNQKGKQADYCGSGGGHPVGTQACSTSIPRRPQFWVRSGGIF